MARITIEDCASKIENHFDLAIVASKRARQIANGAHIDYDSEFIKKIDKPAIIALREIAHDRISVDSLKEDIVIGYRKFTETDEEEDFEEEEIEFDSFDDPEMIAVSEKEEIDEDGLSVIDDTIQKAK